MKVTKHKVNYLAKGEIVSEFFFNTKERAMQYIEDSKYLEYAGEVEFDVYCASCCRDLVDADCYIKVDEETRYCSDCYEENTITTYFVGGEYVGDDDSIVEYDDLYRED